MLTMLLILWLACMANTLFSSVMQKLRNCLLFFAGEPHALKEDSVKHSLLLLLIWLYITE